MDADGGHGDRGRCGWEKNPARHVEDRQGESRAKLNTIKDEKKWTLAFFEFFAKEAKRNAKNAETGSKALSDPNLKAWAEKAAAMLGTQADQIEAKFKELKSAKK